MARRTKENALETRNLLLDAAETVFSEKGVSKTTLNDIAKTAGLTRGAIYWHFKNKADLFDAMLQRVILPMDEFLSTPDTHPEHNPLAYVRERTLHVVRALAEDLRTQRVFDIVMHKAEMVEDMLSIRDQHLKTQQGCIQKIKTGFEAAIAKGELPPNCHAQHAAMGLHALIDGLFANWILSPGSFNLMELAEFSIDHYLFGLLNRGTTSKSGN